MNLDKAHAQKILELYKINETADSLEVLVDIDFFHQEERVIKHYVRVHVLDKTYILKLLRLPMCPDIVLEKQAELSQKYRENGIPTPKCYKSGERYCIGYKINGLDMKILLEEDAGEMLTGFSKETVLQIAEILGKMHVVSLKNKWSFRTGSFYREFEKGVTEYLPLWKKTGTDFLPPELLNEVVEKYNYHLAKMKTKWSQLPVSTVQGDMYRMNLMRNKKGLMIIDYDRAGDEVLVSDILNTWFRIIFDPVIQREFTEVADKTLWADFLNVYEEQRLLTLEEKDAMKDQYFVLGAVYGTRNLVEMASCGKSKEAAEGLKKLLDILG